MGSNLKNYILLTSKSWHDNLFNSLIEFNIGNWTRISKKSDFTLNNIESINPSYIFIPHWSYIIPKEIFSKYKCIVFHMTDLPFGRGGSPLQNLIIRGHKFTKISAINVVEEIDAGDIYMKKKLSLEGSAIEIFENASNIIKDMILELIQSHHTPQKQTGEIVYFKRRKSEDSNLEKLDNLELIFDYIRMLDCEGYPQAYIENDFFKFEFSKANFENNNTIIANVRISKK